MSPQAEYEAKKVDAEERRKYIGGSEVAGVLGLSRWSSPLRVWAEKCGEIPVKDLSDKIEVKLGNKLEQTVAELFTEETGKKVRRVNETLFHPKYSFLGANIDRRIVGEDSIFEAKTTSAFKGKEWEGEEIPQEYIIQVMHYLAVTGMQKAYIAVLIGNHDFKWKEVARDEKVISQMVAKEVKFWNEFVIPKVMPMQITSNDKDVLTELFPEAAPESVIELDDEANKLIESRNALYQDKISVEKQIEQQENYIRALLKDNEAGESQNWRVSWKKRRVQPYLDTEALKKAGLYSQYEVFNKTRVLTIKPKKGETHGKAE